MLVYAGFDKKETEELFRKYLKIEQDLRNIQVYKFELLSLDLCKAFSKYVFEITNLLELNELNELKPHTVKRAQESINADMRVWCRRGT